MSLHPIVLSSGGKGGGEEPVTALRCLSKSCSFAGFVHSPLDRDGFVCRRSKSINAMCVRAQKGSGSGTTKVSEDGLVKFDTATSSDHDANRYTPTNGVLTVSDFIGISSVNDSNCDAPVYSNHATSSVKEVDAKSSTGGENKAPAKGKLPVNVE
jgi:hypothetical protein